MAALKLQVSARRRVPGGPQAVGIPSAGGKLRVVRPPSGSKKGHAGSVNGIGRRVRPGNTSGRPVPSGPGSSAFPVRLPNRGVAARQAAQTARSRPAQGSLMNRIGTRLRRTASAFGF